jgi:1,4-dihydroxy-2-naphthoate octaprenyltransferase
MKIGWGAAICVILAGGFWIFFNFFMKTTDIGLIIILVGLAIICEIADLNFTVKGLDLGETEEETPEPN